MALLENLPDLPTEIQIPLPEDSNTSVFKTIVLDWVAKGHPPDAIYGVPHFDFHFYLISQDDRELITLEGESLQKAEKVPEPELIPTSYVQEPNSAVPHMGFHWTDPNSEEHQEPHNGFDSTLIYGFYDGEMVFIEPMASLAFLEKQEDFSKSFPVPEKYPESGSYPTKYSISYDEEKDEYLIRLSDFMRYDV